jgi:hypothetical protein
MTVLEKGVLEFAAFAARLKGDEKSEAQTFLFHFLEAFGHDANTVPEGATFEYRVRFAGAKTKFADLVWPQRVLIEMKTGGAKLTTPFRYTSDTVCDTFPWPQFPEACSSRRKEARTSSSNTDEKDRSLLASAATMEEIRAVTEAARARRALRREIMAANGWSLRDLYRTRETPGANRLGDAQSSRRQWENPCEPAPSDQSRSDSEQHGPPLSLGMRLIPGKPMAARDSLCCCSDQKAARTFPATCLRLASNES